MSKLGNLADSNVLVTSIEEVPRISDAERSALRRSLDQARIDIAEGRFDVTTSETLRAEFDGIFAGDETDEQLDARLRAGPGLPR